MPEAGRHAPILIATSWQALGLALNEGQDRLICNCTYLLRCLKTIDALLELMRDPPVQIANQDECTSNGNRQSECGESAFGTFDYPLIAIHQPSRGCWSHATQRQRR